MENIISTHFTQFLHSILNAEQITDQFKAKIFYKPPQQIWNILSQKQFKGNDQINQQSNKNDKDSNQIITFIHLIAFINSQNNLAEQKINHKMLLNEQQKIILLKYFRFNNQFTQTKEQFFKKFKPINNKLVISCQMPNQVENKGNLSTSAVLVDLLKSILTGFKNIKQEQKKCRKIEDKIFEYFDKNYKTKFLTLESMKSYMYEANIYTRVNFNYLKEYIFGDKQQKIDWELLFKKQYSLEMQSIHEEQSECIQSQKNIQPSINQNLNKKLTPKKLNKGSRQKINDENQSKITKDFHNRNKSQIFNIFNDQFNHHSSQSSEKSQKSQEQHHDKKQEKEVEYESVISQIHQIQNLIEKTKQKHIKNRASLLNQTQSILKNHSFINSNTESNTNSKQKISDSPVSQTKSPSKLIPNSIDRESNILNNNRSIIGQSSFLYEPNYEISSKKREAGKIKRRSLSKQNEIGSIVHSNDLKVDETKLFNSIISEMKKKDNIFDRHFEPSKKIKQYIKLEKMNNLKEDLYINIKISNNKDLSKSRVSSQKREEIVKKATSQARLRIQEIQRRALDRMSKISNDLDQTPKFFDYKSQLKKETVEKQGVLNTTHRCVKQLSKPLFKHGGQIRHKYLMQNLLNERPIDHLKVHEGKENKCKREYNKI